MFLNNYDLTPFPDFYSVYNCYEDIDNTFCSVYVFKSSNFWNFQGYFPTGPEKYLEFFVGKIFGSEY